MTEEIQEPIQLQVAPGEAALERIDLYLVHKLPEFSRSRLQSLIRGGFVRVNGHQVKPKYALQAQDSIEIEIPPPEPAEAQPEAIPLNVLFEDDHLVVIDKPEGMVVHPGAGNLHGTLVNALLGHCRGQLSGIGGVERPGIVHRLDKDTSGCIVVAKHDAAHTTLSAAFAGREVRKEYLCVVSGRLSETSGRIENFIGRNPGNRQKMGIVEERLGRRACTDYSVLNQGTDFAAVLCLLHTGRTHQIRVHMAYGLGHAILGDVIYGKGTLHRQDAGRLMLHAWRLGFTHPVTGESIALEAPLPENFGKFLVG